MLRYRVLLFAVFLCMLSSCKKDEATDTHLPIVFVHGYFGSGDSFEWMARRFTSNGYASSKIYTFDWNSTTQYADRSNTVPLKRFIEKVLQKTGATKVNLVGHSMGGSLNYNFCKNPENAALVANLVLIAPYLTDRTAVPNAGIPTLNIWPDTDFVVTDGDSIPGAINILLHNKDHNEAAACDETFEAIYQLFTGKAPATLQLTQESEPVVSGRGVSFIENTISAGARVEVYAVDPQTGYRLSSSPLHAFYTDAYGYWGPMPADPKTYYEFKISTGKPGDRPLHYYHEPFIHSDRLVYLRTYPPRSSLLNAVLSAIPKNNSQASAIFFCTSKALWLGRDDLSINGISLSNQTFLDPLLNTAAILLYDDNNNQQSDLTSAALFQSFNVIKGADFYFPANPPASITFNYNGRILHTPNWPSADEGISVALFE